MNSRWGIRPDAGVPRHLNGKACQLCHQRWHESKLARSQGRPGPTIEAVRNLHRKEDHHPHVCLKCGDNWVCTGHKRSSRWKDYCLHCLSPLTKDPR